MNKHQIIGRIKKIDPINNGTRLSVSTMDRYRDKDNQWKSINDYHIVVCFGWMHERARSMTVNDLVYVEGPHKVNKYIDKLTGIEKTSSVIIAREIELLLRKKKENKE